ncbi:hypothetical protein Pelo_19676 [Pelomyxa schiedti]|nr:hypothetical protein Pelo_19676 [Pelomyxa schiedti]
MPKGSKVQPQDNSTPPLPSSSVIVRAQSAAPSTANTNTSSSQQAQVVVMMDAAVMATHVADEYRQELIEDQASMNEARAIATKGAPRGSNNNNKHGCTCGCSMQHCVGHVV